MAILSLGTVFCSHQSNHLSNGTKLSSSTVHVHQKRKNANIVSRLHSPYSSMHQPPLDNTIDLKLTIDRSVLVSPTEATERRAYYLSNIDQTVNFMTHTIQFFEMNPDFPFKTIVDKIEMAYRKLLVPYDFMAGRLKWNTEEGRLEIDCNLDGAGFVVASSELRLEELGDLVCPKLCYQQLAPRKLKSLYPKDQPLVIIQVTSFTCGGFAMGYSINHLTLDGISSVIFARNLASLISNNSLVLPPYNNRKLLAGRSPPHVNFQHPEVILLEDIKKDKANQILMKATFRKLDCKVFYLSADDITVLNDLARKNSLSSFNIIAAHIWRCVALAQKLGNDVDTMSTFLYAVNIRPRVRPRLPTSYSGNGVLNAYCTTTLRELTQGPISRIAEMITQGATRMTDEYIRSIIDYAGGKNLVPCGDLHLTSWLHHEIDDNAFPWGLAKWSSPVVGNHGNNSIILLPDINGKTNGGINVLMSLPHKEMEKFKCLFYTFQG